MIYIVIIVPILAWFNHTLPWDLSVMNGVIALFILLSIAHLAYLRRYPCRHLALRKWVAIGLDMMAITAMVGALRFDGFPFAFLYLWVIFGNRVRFGSRYLLVAMGMAVTRVVIIVATSPWWRNEWQLWSYLLMAVVVLPLFMLKLLRRIRQANEELARLVRLTAFRALHDPLTNLPNRTHFARTLEEHIAEGKPFAVLMLDLDGFKAVNDRYGHLMGDKLLVEVARRLQSCVPHGIAARLGGDEFVALVEGDRMAAEAAARCIVDSLAQPYRLEGKSCRLSASVGISLYPDDTERPFYLKKYADMAMYTVKQHTKNGYLFYDKNKGTT